MKYPQFTSIYFMMLWEKTMTAICRFAYYTFIMFMCLVHVFQDSRCFSLSLHLAALLWLEAPSQKKGSKLHCGSAFGAISCSCGWTDGCTAAAFEAVILTTPDYYWVPQTLSLWVLNGFDAFLIICYHFYLSMFAEDQCRKLNDSCTAWNTLQRHLTIVKSQRP